MGGLEKISIRIAQGVKESGNDAKIVARFTQKRHSLKEYFTASEEPRNFDNEGILTSVIGLNFIQKLLLKPVFKLIWRKLTFPIARSIYIKTLRSALSSACKEADVIHFFGTGFEMLGFLSKEVASRNGAKLVIEPALHEGQWGDLWVDKKLYQEADLLLVGTEHEGMVLQSMGITAERIKVVTMGVDFNTDGDAKSFRKKHGIEGPIILFLGRKTQAKGVLRLIDAWPRVLIKHPEATLVIAGPHQGKESYQLPVSSLDLDDLDDCEKQSALAACDILCVPSEGESFGMVYYEAWSYGKPVVALDLPPLRESIGKCDAGLLVDMNTGSLSEAICQLLDDPEASKKMGERGCGLSVKHHWKNAIHSYLNAYSSIVFRNN